MGEQRSAFEAAGWVDRITAVDGTLLTKEDGVPFDEARRMAQQLEARGEGYRWERWCGERSGWNLVKGYFPVGDGQHCGACGAQLPPPAAAAHTCVPVVSIDTTAGVVA